MVITQQTYLCSNLTAVVLHHQHVPRLSPTLWYCELNSLWHVGYSVDLDTHSTVIRQTYKVCYKIQSQHLGLEVGCDSRGQVGRLRVPYRQLWARFKDIKISIYV